MEIKNKFVEFTTVDNFIIKGTLCIPNKIKNFAILLHGITVTRNEFNDYYTDLADILFDNDIGSLRFDFRGHGQSEGSSMDVSIKGDVLDIEACINYIKTLWNKEIFIIATSFGAGPAILVASNYDNFIKGLILIAPVISYKETFLEPRTDWAKKSFNKESFDNLNKKGYILLDNYFKLSPILIEEFNNIDLNDNLSSLKLPILLIHGNKDTMVPYSVSKYISNKFKNIQFITLINADHGYPDINDETGNNQESLKNKNIIFNNIITFIKKVM